MDTFLLNQNIKIIGLTEHWLKSEELPLHLPEGYVCPGAFCRTNHIRGGSLVLVHNSLQARVCDVSQFCSELNIELSAVFLDDLKIIVVAAYHSPSGDPNIFLTSFEKLLLFLSQWSGYTSIIGGDFNINFDVTKNSSYTKQFLNVLRQHNYYYLNTLPTRGKNCLDNVMVNCCRERQISCKIFDFPFSDHDGVLVDMPYNNSTQQKLTEDNKSTFKMVLPIKHIGLLIDKLGSYDWEIILRCINPCAQNVCSEIFKILINNIHFLIILVRVRTGNSKTNNNNWYTTELAAMKNHLIFLDKLVNNSRENSNQIKQMLRRSKINYKRSIIEAKIKHNTDLIEQSSNKCKTAWRVIKSNNKLISENKLDSNISPDSFNNYFVTSVLDIKNKIGIPSRSSEELIQSNKPPFSNVAFTWKPITPQDIIKATKRLKNSDTNDVYFISNNLLKQIINTILEPLLFCFNLCLSEGVFPDELKISRVCPIFKKGPKNKPESYRPISIIPTISKLFELLVFDQISSFFEENNLLSLSQFGFRKGKSTTEAIDKLVNEVLTAFENKVFAQATLCDLSKAFDCVNHSDLLKKLNYYGVREKELNFFRSYLNKRKQKVLVNGDWSQEVEVEHGVPQGSVLGPLLFLICINDLPNSIKCKTFLYADDTTFFNFSSNFNELQILAQNSLASASEWFKTNGFLLNEDKTQNIIFTLKHTEPNIPPDNYTNQVKFLGIHIDKGLSWGAHIDYISSKLSRVIFLIKKLTNCIDKNYIISAYFAYFQSIFRYGLIFYGNSSRIDEILILQKKVIRILYGAESLDHCKPIFLTLNIQTVINLYIYDLILYIFKNPNVIKYVNHSYSTRNKIGGLATIDFSRLSKTINSHCIVSLKIHNKLCHLINKYDQNLFCRKFYNWLLANPFYSIDEFFNLQIISF